MAYNKRNLLHRMIAVQELTLEMKKKGVTQTWIFNNVIRDRYNISEKTYNNYLSTNAKKELKELERVQSETMCKQETPKDE